MKLFLSTVQLFFLFTVSVHISAQSGKRYQHTINSAWKYNPRGNVYAYYPNLDDSHWETINFPHTFNAADAMDDERGYYRGSVWYRKEIAIDSNWIDKQVFIQFEGANQITRLFVNGHFAGEHTGGYTGFTFDITDKLRLHLPENNISIWVDNAPNPHIPPLAADFTFFGGVYRDVKVIVTNKIHFNLTDQSNNGVYWQTPKVSEDEATLRIFGSMVNNSKSDETVFISHTIIDPQGNSIETSKSKLNTTASQSHTFESIVKIDNPLLWSPDNPYRYQIVSQIVNEKGEVIDQTTNPLGFRWFKFDADKGFFLNGKPLKLMEANRHQDFPGLGNALPDDLHRKDIELLKEMGANFVRIAHYPQDPAVMEACDRLGLLASVEIPIVSYLNETQEFRQNSLEQQKEMIRQNNNHPSVIIWAYMNEAMINNRYSGDRYDQYREFITTVAKDIEELTRREDPYRYTMIPNHQNFGLYSAGKLTEIPMIVGWNLYPGWYGKEMEGLEDFLENVHRVKLPDKPVIITEYGAGADPRIRTTTPQRFDFSIEYQLKLHEYYLDVIMEKEYISGAAIWNFIDFQSEKRGDAVAHINSKGVLTTERKPKDAYYLYQAKLSKNPVIAITPTLMPTRGGMEDMAGNDISTQKISVFTNQDSIKLFHNGVELPLKRPENNQYTWEVPFQDGINTLYAVSGFDPAVNDYQEIDFQVYHQNLIESDDELMALNINVGSHTGFLDNEGTYWMPDKIYKKGNWGFIDGEVYERGGGIVNSKRDIMGTLNDPIFQTQRIDLTAYQFDVPNGMYEIELFFCELLSQDQLEKSVYNLGMQENDETASNRIFTVLANDEPIIKDLNLMSQYGEARAVIIKSNISVVNNEGLSIRFDKKTGHSVLNGIRIRKIY